MFRLLALTLLTSVAFAATTHAQDANKSNLVYMDTSKGRVVIELKPDLAPKHVERIKELTKKGFYNGVIFHRVIPGFMAQTGDPTGTGTGGSDLPDLKAEFSNANFGRGTVAAARTSDPDTANSQFFICFDAQGCQSLYGQYTIWGQVVDGMNNVDAIAPGEPPANPDKIVKMQMAEDADKTAQPAAQ